MSIYETTIKNPKKIAEFYKQLSEQKDIEIKQLKEQLKTSEKVRKEAIDKLKTLGKFDGENFTRSFTLWSADFNELAKILDIDKGE